MSTSILVTGATGNVGRATVAALARRGATVRAATRKPESYAPPAGSVSSIYLNFDDPDSFAPALEGCERLLLMAAPMDAGAAPKLRGLLDRAKAAGLERAVMLSAMGVEHAPASSLGQVEAGLKASGLAWTILRPNWFLDNFHPGWMSGMIKAGTIGLPAGDARVSFIAAEDIGEAAAVTLTEEGHLERAYTLTGPESLNWEQVAAHFASVTGHAVRYQPIGDEDMRQAMAAQGLPASSLDYLSALFAAMRAGASAPVAGDINGLIGRAPRSLADFTERRKSAWA